MNYAMQITTTGIFIHESYYYVKDPDKKNLFATKLSDTGASSMSRLRKWIPSVGKVTVPIGNINLTGSHGCIRLAHSDAVQLFNWSDIGVSVEVI